MAVGRGAISFLLIFLSVFLLIAPQIQATEKDDSNEENDLPSLSDCKSHVLKALDNYWKSADDEEEKEDGDGELETNDGKLENKDDDDDDDKNGTIENEEKDHQDEAESTSKEDDSELEDGEKNVDVDKSEDDEKNDEGDESGEKTDEGNESGEETDEDDGEKADQEINAEAANEEPDEVIPEQEEITQAEVQEVASADDFVNAEDEPEEELEEMEVPQTGRDHIDKIMELDEETDEMQKQETKLVNNILKDLKRMYDQTIKPMEQLYKYKDISTRRFADAEIYSQPMVLFVGPWNSGKSTIINYLLDLEGTDMALDTGPASAGSQFMVLTHSEKERKIDGTEIAADWRFAGIQKFGQGFIDALVGLKIPRALLEKITIVEAPGITEMQKNLNYPFDDALQWFIDRADIIYVVFDPSKLAMGPEMELVMDQLKGREKYLRILVNKADTVDTLNLMKVTSQLFWTLSPMLSTPVVPTSYSVSLWSKPYQEHADGDYLSDQEVDMLRDLKKYTIDKVVENKLAHARRHAVTVRNHAKLVDCYLTHYYKKKTLFANKNNVAEEIIDNPEKYKIFESLSALNNVSRYDLPNPDIYKGFFKVTPLYEFKQLKNTCSYFKGCPLDKLNVCIAYDLPQLLGKYKKQLKEIHDTEAKDKDKKK